MTEAQAVEAIKEAFATGWTAAYPSVPYFFDNEAGASSQSFVRVTFIPTVSALATMGPPGQRLWLRRGYIVMQLFAPVDQGSATLDAYVETVRALLEGASIAAGVATDDAGAERKPDDGTWAQVNVRIAYRVYDAH